MTAPRVLVLVFAGGMLGGLARYLLTEPWPAAEHGLPWAVFTINTGGAFALATLLPYAFAIPQHRWLRPLVATGFLGAFTTFAAVVTTADEMVADGRAGTAGLYVAATAAAGLTAAAFGHALGRRLTRDR
jgi:CrcB protein